MVSLKATLGFPEITGQLYSVFILYDKIDRNYTNHHQRYKYEKCEKWVAKT